MEGGFLVVCVGGGGVPVIADGKGHKGVEAVIDKDLASGLLAAGLEPTFSSSPPTSTPSTQAGGRGCNAR